VAIEEQPDSQTVLQNAQKNKIQAGIKQYAQLLARLFPAVKEDVDSLKFIFPFSVEDAALVEQVYDDGSCALLIIDPLSVDLYRALIGRIVFNGEMCHYEPYDATLYHIGLTKKYIFEKLLLAVNLTDSILEGNTLTVPCVFDEVKH